jgi:olefin beta-lactone synthetase
MNTALLSSERARDMPHVAALIDTQRGASRVLTYSEMEKAASQATRLLSEMGLQAGDVVLILLGMSADLYVALLAILRSGLVAMFVDPGAGREHIERCCAARPPRGLIASRRAHLLRLISPAVAGIPVKFSVGGGVPGAVDFTRYRKLAPWSGLVRCDESTPALITFTSGSTGPPRAALRTHGFLLKQQRVLERCLAPAAGDIELTALPMFVLSNLASGVTTVIPDADLRQPDSINAGPVVRQIMRHGVNRIVAPPAFLERIVSHCRTRGTTLDQITTVFTGGAPVFPGLMRRLQSVMRGARIVAVYGSTEAEPIAHIAWSEISADDEASMLAGKGLLAGRPVRDIDLRIIPANLEIPAAGFDAAQFAGITMEAGRVGEIVVSGKHVLNGYLNRCVGRPIKFSAAGRLWHRTGDLGYQATDARLWLLGRSGAEIRDARGVLYPFAVECAAQHHAGVRRAALISVGGERVLLVEPVDSIDDSMLDELARRLRWAGLDALHAVPALPVDYRHNSKIDYPKLQQLLQRKPIFKPFGVASARTR